MPQRLFCNPPPLHEILYGPCRTAPPPPIPHVEHSGEFIRAGHANTHGGLPPLGLYLFQDCFVAHAGLVLSAEREVFDAPDLISGFWKSHLVAKARGWKPDDPLGRFLTDPAALPVRTLDDGDIVSLVKPGYQVYGHWLLDMLPMAWLFQRSAWAATHPVRFLIGSRTPSWARAMLHTLFGLTDSDLVTMDDAAEVLLVRRLIVPSLMRRSPLLSPGFNDFVRDVQAACGADGGPDPELPRRLFITRQGVAPSGGTARVPVDADGHEALARSKGIAVIRPETLPWVKQVAMFAHAELVVGDFGSGLHNTILSDDRSITVAMGNSQMNWNQSAIAALRRHRLQYVMPSAEKHEAGRLILTYDLGGLERCLDQMLDELETAKAAADGVTA